MGSVYETESEIWACLGRLGIFCAKLKDDFHIISSAFVTETNVIQFLDWPNRIGPAQNILGPVEGHGIIEIANHRTYIQ